MLTNLENQLVGLLEQIETMPADKVEAAEKVGSHLDFYKDIVLWVTGGKTL